MTSPEFNAPRPPGPPYSGGLPQYPPPLYAPPPAVPAQRNKKTGRRVVAAVILVVVVVVIGVLAWQSQRSSPDAAVVGDCVSHGSGDDIKVVACTDATAAFKVVGKVQNKTQTDFNLSSESICKPFPGVQSAFWKGKVGSTGYILCLAPAK